jgi:hypothetical protein
MKQFFINLFLLPQKALLFGIIFPIYVINLLLTHPLQLLSFKQATCRTMFKACKQYGTDLKNGNLYTTTIAWLTLLPLVAITFPIQTLHFIIAWQKKHVLILKRIFDGDTPEYIVFANKNLSFLMLYSFRSNLMYIFLKSCSMKICNSITMYEKKIDRKKTIIEYSKAKDIKYYEGDIKNLWKIFRGEQPNIKHDIRKFTWKKVKHIKKDTQDILFVQ